MRDDTLECYSIIIEFSGVKTGQSMVKSSAVRDNTEGHDAVEPSNSYLAVQAWRLLSHDFTIATHSSI